MLDIRRLPRRELSPVPVPAPAVVEVGLCVGVAGTDLSPPEAWLPWLPRRFLPCTGDPAPVPVVLLGDCPRLPTGDHPSASPAEGFSSAASISPNPPNPC